MSPRCPALAGLLSCSPRALKAGASTGPAIGLPWPGASTLGSSRASSDTDSVAARQFQVAKRGGPPRVCRCDRASPGELRLTVRTASPAMRARSASRNSARWPGVWPGVGMTCQSGRPGTPTSGSIGLSPSCPEGNIQRRSTPAKAPMMRPEGGNGSSPGCTYTVTSHMRASSEAEPAWSGCTCVSTIARGRAPAPNRVSAALLINSARPRHAVSTRTQVPPDCTK